MKFDEIQKKFSEFLSEFFLNFKPQKFNLCDCVSKKVRISYIFFSNFDEIFMKFLNFAKIGSILKIMN